jgi:hypothetical protein
MFPEQHCNLGRRRYSILLSSSLHRVSSTISLQHRYSSLRLWQVRHDWWEIKSYFEMSEPRTFRYIKIQFTVHINDTNFREELLKEQLHTFHSRVVAARSHSNWHVQDFKAWGVEFHYNHSKIVLPSLKFSRSCQWRFKYYRMLFRAEQ